MRKTALIHAILIGCYGPTPIQHANLIKGWFQRRETEL
jgi:hypothetical protein